MHDVAEALAEIRSAIDAACARAGRAPESVTLVGASKRQPPAKLQAAWAAGLRTFGENRVQEILAKAPEMQDEVDWHLIGPLQSNKARRAVAHCSTIHSIDRPKIARAVDRHAGELGREIVGLLEVNVGEEPSKHGFSPDGLVGAVRDLAELEHLRIAGLMAIPPYEPSADEARRWFRRLRELRDDLFSRAEWSDREGHLSMGMSHDFALAIEEGATHVRVGTALFGVRDP